MNKNIVLQYFDLTFNQHRPDLAAERYLSADYIHHGKGTTMNRQDFVTYFLKYFKEFPKFKVTVLKCISEGDMVVLHVFAERYVAEFYRLKDGKITEHWDVVGS